PPVSEPRRDRGQVDLAPTAAKLEDPLVHPTVGVGVEVPRAQDVADVVDMPRVEQQVRQHDGFGVEVTGRDADAHDPTPWSAAATEDSNCSAMAAPVARFWGGGAPRVARAARSAARGRPRA